MWNLFPVCSLFRDVKCGKEIKQIYWNKYVFYPLCVCLCVTFSISIKSCGLISSGPDMYLHLSLEHNLISVSSFSKFRVCSFAWIWTVWTRKMFHLLSTSWEVFYYPICFSSLIGDVARVNGQLAVSRAFGDKSLKSHLRSDPDIQNRHVDGSYDLLVLASDGLWKVINIFLKFSSRNCVSLSSDISSIQVMDNQEAVDIARRVKDPQKAAKQLTAEALKRDSKDDISCVVVRFRR